MFLPTARFAAPAHTVQKNSENTLDIYPKGGYNISRRQERHLYSSLAQLAEHAAVNRRVVGSSPTGGARKIAQPVLVEQFLFEHKISGA